MFWRKPKPPVPVPDVGDVLRSADRRTHAVVVRVDRGGEPGAVLPDVVVHLTSLRFDGRTSGHFPFALEALRTASVVDRWEGDAWVPEAWSEEYGQWRDAARTGRAGVFSLPIEGVF